MSTEAPKRDLVLPPGTYAYMQDVTKGVVKTYTGPTVINPTAQERPVVYDSKSGTFKGASSLEDAMRISPVAAEGSYIILRNPARANKHPEEGSAQPSAEQEIGRAIIVPGPVTFALWPGQAAEVVEGHHLRSNQYLLVCVYNEDEARKNWSKAVVKPATPEGGSGAGGPSAGASTDPTAASPPDLTVGKQLPPDLTVGKQLIIRGTEVSFYIPSTGIEVLREAGSDYTREALTLERLEYAILVDENGKKRYEVGPQVVFPLPTERFVEARDDAGRPSKKFRAVELNEIQGLHIKVIADYTDGGRTYRAGEELFVTGKDTAIYYPREEHSAVKYDGKTKHFAVAVPAGEGRYVMNRLTGEIRTVHGPEMLLPDSRNEVIVRRVLSDRECTLWYPGNGDALLYNRGLREIMANVPTTRQGALSEGDVERGSGKKATARNISTVASVASASVMESSRVSGDQGLAGDEFSRSSTYTQPRTVTLDTKFSGVPQICPFTGYAVMVSSKSGQRRVEVGPKTVLLDYDEGLEVLSLSTGRPKTTDKLVETPYLRVENNQVSDTVQVETSDHVVVEIKLSYLVNFEGDPLRWFSVENYVKFLCDHVRSVLKGRIRRLKVEEFYGASTDVIRDTILGSSEGGKRSGMRFEVNGMRVADVEVLKVELKDDKIRGLLDQAQHDVVRSNIDLSNARRGLDVLRQKEEVAQQEQQVRATTARLRHEIEAGVAASELALVLVRLGNDIRKLEQEQKVQMAKLELEHDVHAASLVVVAEQRDQEAKYEQVAQDRRIVLLRAEAESIVQRFAAAQGGFSEALLALSHNDTMVQVARAWEVQRAIAGDTLAGTLGKLFDGTPLRPLLEKMLTPTNGVGKSAPPASAS
jgi:major vault protein